MRYDSEIKLFSGTSNRSFSEKISEHLGVKLGSNDMIAFPEGNLYVKINEKVRGTDVYIIQSIGLNPNNEFVELLFWLDAFKRSGVNSVTAIVPYFSYAKADKKDEPRVSIRARVCADCMETAGVDRIVTMDLHSPQIQGFFRKPVDHLYAANIFCNRIKELGADNAVIVSPDEGFAKNARYYSNRLTLPLAIGNKQRLYHDNNAEILSIMGTVRDKTAIIVDDFSISGGTLDQTAKRLLQDGAKEVYAFISHAALSADGVKTIAASPIKKLFTTDTIFNENIIGCEKIELISVSKMFAEAIRIIHERDSLGDLFQ